MPVAHAMVCGKRGGDQRPGYNLAIERPGAFDKLTETDERDLVRIDDAKKGFDPLLSKTRDGNRWIAKLRATERTGARSLYQVAKILH